MAETEAQYTEDKILLLCFCESIFSDVSRNKHDLAGGLVRFHSTNRPNSANNRPKIFKGTTINSCFNLEIYARAVCDYATW